MAIPKNSLVHFTLQERAAWWGAQEEKRAVVSAIPPSVIALDSEAVGKNFLPNAVLGAYIRGSFKGAPEAPLSKALAERQVEFVHFDFNKKNYLLFYLLRAKTTTSLFYEGMTPKGASCTIAVPKDPKAVAPFSYFQIQPYLILRKCPNILHLKRHQGLHTLFEPIQGTLEDSLRQAASIPSPHNLLRGCLKGVVQMVDRGMLHLNLSPGNILMGPNGVIKIAGLQFTTPLDQVKDSLSQSNVFYDSPERRSLACGMKTPDGKGYLYGHVDAKSSGWAVIHLLYFIALHFPEKKWLSPDFLKRFKEYEKELDKTHDIARAHAEGKGAQNELFSYRSCFHHQILAYFSMLPESKKFSFNLFYGLTPRAPLDPIFFLLGYLQAQKRGTPEEALSLFNTQIW